MKQKLLSLLSCVLISCNIFTTISHAEELTETPVEVTEEISDEVVFEDIQETTDEEVEYIENQDEEIVNSIENEILIEENADSNSEEEVSTEEGNLEKIVTEEAEESQESFTVSFIDSVEDKEFASYTVNEGESIEELPEAPSHEGYEFVEYIGNYSNVISDEEVIAEYKSTEDNQKLVYQELSADVAGYTILIRGNMPDDTELVAEKIENTEPEKTIEDELDVTFEAQVSFDIKLMSGNEQYQPTDYSEEVSVSIKGVDTSEQLNVYRITDDGTVTDMSASNIGEAVEFETNHFTTYTVGTTDYESMSSGTFMGLKYEYYDTDGDGNEDLIVVTGEQKAPYSVRYKDDIECDAYLKKYINYPVYNYQGGKNRLIFCDLNDGIVVVPWKKNTITKCHFNNVKLKNAYELFKNCDNLQEIVFDSVDTSECFDMGELFSGCNNLSKLVITETLDTGNVKNMDSMFSHCWSLKTLDGEHNFNSTTGLFSDTSKVESFENMFYYSVDLESIDLSNIDCSSAKTMAHMFDLSGNGGFGHESKLKTLKLPNNLKLAPDVTSMFAYNVSLEGGFNTSDWDTSRVTTMDYLFYNCFKLKELNVVNWDMSSVTTISHMLDCCESLQVLDVSDWDVSNVTDMEAALSFLLEVTDLDVSKWDTSSCENMDSLFWGDEKVKALDVSNWNVSKVKNMAQLFTSCNSIEYLNLSKWDVSNVENFGCGRSTKMLQYCDNLKTIDMFRTDVVKETAGIPEMPMLDSGYHSVHGPAYMYIDDNKDGKADSSYKKVYAFMKDSVSHRYISVTPEIEKNTLEDFNNNYTIINLIEPSDDVDAYEYFDEEYGKVIRHNRYLVKDFEILKEECLDENDPLNTTGRAYVYTIKMDNDVLKVISGDYSEKPGPDGTYGTDDDFSYWGIEPANYLMYQPLNPISQLKKDEYYEWFKDFVIYSTGEKITLSRDEWDFNVAEGNEMKYMAYTFRLAKFKLVLKDENGKVLYSDHVTYGEPLEDILKVYGKKWIDAEGEEYTPGTMPIKGMTLTRVHTHTPAASKTENNVKPTHTKDGHYDSVVYCEECGAELSRETITVAATDHVPGTPVEENRVEATCTEPGHYESVVYCVDDGDVLSRETITLEPLGHIAGAEVRENVVDATEEEEGSYESVVYCKHCHIELSRETKSIPKIEKNKPQDIVNPSGNDNPGPSQEPTMPGTSDDNKPSDLIIDIVIDEEEETPINPGNELIVSLPNSKPDSNRIDDDLELKTVDIVAMSDDSQLTKVDLKDDKVNDNANEPSFVEKVIKAVVVTVSVAGTTGGIFFVIIWFRRRKVRGKLISKDGINYSNCVVTLEGKDKLRTRTNKNGEFIFRNLKKDTYILTVFNESDEILFSCELLTSSKDMKDEKNITVLENNALAYQYGVAGETYILDIFA